MRGRVIATLDGSLIQAQPGHFIGILACISISFLFSGLEAGLLSLNRIRLSELVNQGSRSAAILQKILNNPSRLISVMLTMETSSNVVLTILWTIIGTWYVHAWELSEWLIGIWSALLLLVIVMFLEITPKAIFTANSEKFTMALAPVANVLIGIVHPFAAILEWSSKVLIWIFTRKWLKPIKTRVTEEDLLTLVNVGEDEGVIVEQEKEMIHSIFEFGDLVAREIMVPRVDMVALDLEDNIEKAISLIIEKGHSRIPVYEESPDHIRGILYAKDILRHLEKGDHKKHSLGELMRPHVHFVPGTKDLTSLLEEMRRRKAHLAIVMDEYGGTAGLVTIEDILEEIVGDIQDEYDKPLERLVTKNEDGTFIVDGKLGLHDFVDEVGVRLPEPDGVETVGGLLYQVLGRVPEINEHLEVIPVPDDDNDEFVTNEPDIGLVKFTVMEVEENRIGDVHVCLEICEPEAVVNGKNKNGGEE